MTSAFLSREDVATLTGRQRRADQAAQLRAMGLPFFVNAAGWPVVARVVIEGSTAGKMAVPEPMMNL